MRGALLCCAVFGCGGGGPQASEPAPEPAPIADVALQPEPAPEPAVEPESVSADPPTGLPLTLLATLAAATPKEGRATIRHGSRGVIAMFRAGELVADGVRLAEVWPDYVVVDNEGERERVSFEEGLASVSATDVFYPDLVELDDRTNSMADAVQLGDGPGYVVKKPVFAWGTPRTVAAIQQAVRTYTSEVDGGPDVRIGDISKRQGGPFPPHLSHQTGRDVDIGYILTGAQAKTRRFVTATRHSLDRDRSWKLVRAMLDTDAVGYIFLDYGLQRLLYEHALASGEDEAWLASVFQYPAG